MVANANWLSCSSTSDDDPTELITRGKRHLYCEDFEAATICFQDACEKL